MIEHALLFISPCLECSTIRLSDDDSTITRKEEHESAIACTGLEIEPHIETATDGSFRLR